MEIQCCKAVIAFSYFPSITKAFASCELKLQYHNLAFKPFQQTITNPKIQQLHIRQKTTTRSQHTRSNKQVEVHPYTSQDKTELELTSSSRTTQISAVATNPQRTKLLSTTTHPRIKFPVAKPSTVFTPQLVFFF